MVSDPDILFRLLLDRAFAERVGGRGRLWEALGGDVLAYRREGGRGGD